MVKTLTTVLTLMHRLRKVAECDEESGEAKQELTVKVKTRPAGLKTFDYLTQFEEF